MDLANVRKLRLLFEDFPKNHNLVLIGRPNLLAVLDLGVNRPSISSSAPRMACCANHAISASAA